MMVDEFTRRRVLQGTAGGIGAAAIAPRHVSAQNQPERRIVGMTTPAAFDRAKGLATNVAHTYDFERFGRAVAGRFPDQAVEALRRRKDVKYIEPDGTAFELGHETTGTQTLPWGIDRIDAEQAQHKGHFGQGADLAIIDTGIDSDHPDLQATLGEGKAFVECGTTSAGDPCTVTNGNTCHQPWDDDREHGTHCAGIAAAVNNAEGVIGVSPETTLHAVKVLDCRGSGKYSDIAAALTYVADQGWDVASMSIGGDTSSQTLHNACKYAYDNGVLLVASAGNEGCEGCVRYPARFPEVIAVSATTKEDTITSFSSTGPEVELAAPGNLIYSTIPGGYETKSGTSMACPHVSGSGAQLMARGYNNANAVTYDQTNTLTPESYESPSGARGQLRETAEDLGLATNQQGNGLVNLEAAFAIGQRFTVDTDQPTRSSWQTASLGSSFNTPVVIMKPVSYNETDPCHIRLQNVTSDSFEYQLEEWSYLDGVHSHETISSLVMETGAYTTTDGTRIGVGNASTNHVFTRVNFVQTFTEVPVVFSQAQSRNGVNPIVVRQRKISNTGFDVRVQEEESRDRQGGGHAVETVGYTAIEPGTGMINGISFEVGRTPNTVTNTWSRIDFERIFEEPVLITDMQTADGLDTAGLRYRNLSESGVEVFVEEDKSANSETSHTTEVVGYLVMEGTGLI